MGYHGAATPTSSPYEQERTLPWPPSIGALCLDVASLLAFVADPLATGVRLLGTLARIVAGFAAIVALHTIDALAGHVTVASARIASLA